MNESHNARSKRLLDALKNPGAIGRDDELHPFTQTADALAKDVARSNEALDPTTKKNQRIMLSNMANATPAAAPVSPTPSPAPQQKTRALWFGGAAATLVAAVLVVAVLVNTPFGGAPVTEQSVIARLLISEAHAGDAFTLVAEDTDAAGADLDTSFKVDSKVAVSAATLKESLRVVPPVPFTVESTGTDTFRIRPSEDLAAGEVYRIQLAAAVQKDDGTVVARDFSWAVQTKDVFRILSSVPANGSSGVPLDTGIEVTMSQTGWTDPAAAFSIEPKVDGRFEVHGRSVAFVPAKPLAEGKMYTVTYKAGWKVEGSDLALAEDHVIRFETVEKATPTVVRLEPSAPFFEGAPGKEVFIQSFLPYDQKLEGPVTMTGYAISNEEAKTVLTDVLGIPWWAQATKKNTDAFKSAAKSQSFSVEAAIDGVGYPTFLRMPGVAAGFYVVRIDPKVGAGLTAEPTWFALQVTDLATYTMSDAQTTLVWAMNVATNRPIVSANVRFPAASGVTGEDGIVRLATPVEFNSTSTDIMKPVIAEVSASGLSALVPLEKGGGAMPFDFRFPSEQTAHDNTWGYLFADRPLYRISDHVSFFGLAQDRDTQRAGENLTVELRRSGFIDFSNNREKVYIETAVTPDAYGFVRGDLNWEVLAPGYYTIALQRDGKDVVTRSIEVRDVVKPAFSIDVMPKSSSMYGGDALEGEVKATLFDGTPMARENLEVQMYGPNDNGTIQVTTDDSGLATFSFPTKRQECNLNDKYAYCQSAWTASVTARPVNAEEAQIQGSAYVTVWAARVATQIETKIENDTAKISLLVRRVDVNAALGREETSVVTDPVGGIQIKGRVVEQTWKRIEEGTTYDYIEKKVVPAYRYELEEKDVRSIDVRTGPDGRAETSLPVRGDVSYRILVTATDESGAPDSRSEAFSKGWVDQGNGDTSLHLEPATPLVDRNGYNLNEEIGVRFMKSGQPVADAATPSYLFVETQRGIKKATVTNKTNYSFRFRDELVPNMTLYGVAFGPSGFIQTDYWASLDTASRKLKVIVISDAASYAPCANVTASIDVTTQDGTAVRGAHVSLAAVDEALLAAASAGDYQEMPLDTLYSGVSNGIVVTRSSHEALNEAMGNGGAEFGGGGSEPIRRNFKDTAHFDVVTTDGGGHATVSFKTPDNITTWRLTAVALMDDLRAGSAKGKAVVTKPVFVDAVIAQTLLVDDKPVLKLRAFGQGLKNGEEITFTVTGESLGFNNTETKGIAGTPVYLAIDKLVAGDHKIVIRVRSASGTDAIERTLRILPSRFTVDELVTTELAPGVSLPDVGSEAEFDVVLSPLGRSKYLYRVESLAAPWSARVESKVAAKLMNALLVSAFGREDMGETDSVLAYQKGSGGIAPLPYASEDVELTAKIAAIAPGFFDRATMANYFWQIADNAKTSREESLRALSGLAALGEPVLNRLQTFQTATDLGWRERLALIRGLDAAGDRETARAMLVELMSTAKTEDGLTWLPVAEDQRSILEATSEAAILAIGMGLPQADEMDEYLSKNWDKDTLTDLDRAAFLARIVPSLLPGDVTVGYSLGGSEIRKTLKDGMSERLTLTSAEAKAFRVISVDGPAAAVFTRRVAQRPAVSTDVSLARSYAVDGGTIDTLTEGQIVRVTLRPTWKDAAQDGCYVVRDRLPSGIAPLTNISFDGYAQVTGAYPFDIRNGEISFVICKDDKNAITYRARVVSRGTYRAEAASIQSMEAPGVTALSDEQTITIK